MVTNTNQTNTSILARTKETCGHFKVSHMTLHRWRKEPDFPQPYKRGRTVLFNIPAIEQWLADGAKGA